MAAQDPDWLTDVENAGEAATPMAGRFRGYLPVVVDVETGGFDCRGDALLEIAITLLAMDESGMLRCERTVCRAVEPFVNSNIEQASLEFTGIDPYSPARGALDESVVMRELFGEIRRAVRETGCKRAILVGHNAFFDHGFVFAAAERTGIKRNPFHPFSTFDTVTLAGMAFGQTVLARACEVAGIDFSARKAHRAGYDCERTALLFCEIVNRWKAALGWPPTMG